MLEEPDKAQVSQILNETEPSDPIPRYTDEHGWNLLLDNPRLDLQRDRLQARAEGLLEEPLEMIPVTSYLSYFRTGNRQPHDGMAGKRRGNLRTLVMAECSGRDGTFLDSIMDRIWAICEESSWVIPAHSRTKLPKYKNIQWVDLVSAGTALTLAECLHVMDPVLCEEHPMIRERVVDEIKRRCWKPFLERDDFPWLFGQGRNGEVNNWAAVCNCGVVGSALILLRDRDRLARMIEKSMQSMNLFLDSFGNDGGCDEGASYWNYGMVNFAWLSYLLESATGGKLSLLRADELRGIARFPQRVTFSGKTVANFSDCPQQVGYHVPLLHYLSKKTGAADVRGFAEYQYDLEPFRYVTNIRDLIWMPAETSPETWKPERRVYLSGRQWMISRAKSSKKPGLVLAAKGGNNGESHNHNDVGNFIVALDDKAMIIDLGKGTYTKDYFGEGRYQKPVIMSAFHNVPHVNGCQQERGRDHRATILEQSFTNHEDVLSMNLTRAYPEEAGIERLVRKLSFRRSTDKGSIVIHDKLLSKSQKGSMVIPVHSFCNISKTPGKSILIDEGSRILKVESQGEVEIKTEERDVEDDHFSQPVKRSLFSVPVQDGQASLILRIEPVD